MPSHTSRRLSEMLPYADLVLLIEFHFLCKDSKRTSEIYSAIKPLIADKKGK